MTTEFVLPFRDIASQCTAGAADALEQAIRQRNPHENDDLLHHSDRGSQYLSIKDTDRLAAVEWETLRWVGWYNRHRLLSSIGYLPPVEVDRRYPLNLLGLQTT